MALTSTIEYCETQDVFDVYPQIDKYNMKRQINSRWILSGGDYYVRNTGFVGRLFKNGEDLGPQEEDAGQVNSPDEWFYNFNFDELILNQDRFQGGTDPNLDIIEIGDVWEDIIERIKRKASRIVEAKLGKSITREILKDREGNYPTSIVHATALKTAILLIMGHEPTSPDLIPLKAKYDEIIARIISGKIVMTGHRSVDDSKGVIRIVKEGTTQHEVFPVEIRGTYRGSNYELLKVVIGGKLLYPTAGEREDESLELFYSVYGMSEDKLKDNLLIDNKLVNGDYQSLGVQDVYIRWGFSEWAAGSGDVFGVRGLQLDEGINGNNDHGHKDAINYTGPNGVTPQSLRNSGDLPYVNQISKEDPVEIAVYNEDLGFFIGSMTTLYNNHQSGTTYEGEEIAYLVETSAAQSEVSYKSGLAIWSDYKQKAEYEIELWGEDIQPTISQIKPTTLSRSALWQQPLQ